jgi:GNAT superfamily N-acetyltransferase
VITVDPEYLWLTYGMSYRGRPDAAAHPEDYPMTWRVDIGATVFADEDSDGEDMKVGHATVRIIPEAGCIDLFDTLDAVDQEMADFAEFLQFRHPEMLHELSAFGGDLMILSSLEITPEFRGRKLGHAALEAILAAIGRNCLMIILRASPFLDDDAEEPAADSPVRAALERYWGSFGFEPAGDGYMVCRVAGGEVDRELLSVADPDDVPELSEFELARVNRMLRGDAGDWQ